MTQLLSAPPPGGGEAPPGITEETRVLVNNAAVRHVIGKAGSMIHKLEQEAGAWISIQSEREMQAEALLRVRGRVSYPYPYPYP